MRFPENPNSASTRELRLRVAEGLTLQHQHAVAPAVLRSWERAQRAGLCPADRALYSAAASNATCRRLEEEHQALISCAVPDMQRLRRSIGSPNWVVLLTNARGTVVSSMGHEFAASRELREPLRIGKDLREESVGTNAPACVLSEGVSTTVIGSEHYLDELQYYSCAAAPIHSPHGQILGALDVTGWQAQLEPDLLQRVVMSARSIENRLLKSLPEVAILQLHHDDRLLGTPLEGLLAVNEAGNVVGANTTAVKLLNGAADTPGLSLFDLISDGMAALMSERGKAETHAQFIRNLEGSGLYARWGSAPAAPRVAVSRPARLAAPVVPVVPGSDITVRRQLERAQRVLRNGLPILIQGETGTGKEIFARQLHHLTRGEGPFVAVSCSALPETLIESELFGYVEGAFTGARRGGASGKLSQAHGGTLFLDEIGDMPPSLQTRLLRALQERAFVPVGGHRPIPVDLLVMAATHRDVSALVAKNAFREDLYYRLSGYVVRLPALRHRSDVQSLIERELERIDPDMQLSRDVWQHMLGYQWPGNLRQLVHTLQAAAALCEHPQRIVQLSDLPTPLEIGPTTDSSTPHASPGVNEGSERGSLTDLKERAINEALTRLGGNVSAVARELKLSRTTVYAHLGRDKRAPAGR